MLSRLLALVTGAINGAPMVALLLALLGGGLGSGFLVAGVKDFWFEHVSTPQIQQAARDEQQKVDADAFEAAAAQAKRELEAKLIRIADEWATRTAKEAAEDDAAHQVEVAELLQEISDYEQGSGDRSACSLTQRDLDFLNGGKLQSHGAADLGRG